jgi:hypothetical protein
MWGSTSLEARQAGRAPYRGWSGSRWSERQGLLPMRCEEEGLEVKKGNARKNKNDLVQEMEFELQLSSANLELDSMYSFCPELLATDLLR